MRCKYRKRKISDLLDGKYSAKQKSILDNHFSQCPTCQDYKNQLMALRAVVREREKKEMPKDYALEFSTKLKSRLLNDQQKKRQKKMNRFPGFEKLVYSASGFIVVLFLFLYFVIFQSTSIQTEGYYVLSFEDAIGDLYGEINNDAELEGLFNTIVLDSLTEALEDLDTAMLPYIIDIENSFFDDEPGEENLKTIKTTIKQKLDREKDIKS